MDWREKINHASEKVFPGITKCYNNNTGNESNSNLHLQMSLFFNVTFFPVWILVMAFYLKNEYSCFGVFQKLIIITIVIAIILTEITRLYLGYLGNLQDKISELATFWLLSFMLQAPLELIIIVNPYFNWQIIEYIVHTTMMIMLSFQIIVGYFALKKIAHYQSTVYRILNSNVPKNKNN